SCATSRFGTRLLVRPARTSLLSAAMEKRIQRRIAITLEELVNVATHGACLVISVVLLPVFVALAARRGDPLVTLGVTIFALTLVLCYAASTVYHATPLARRRGDPPTRRDHWRRLDQSAVYLLIAGTYTPFA